MLSITRRAFYAQGYYVNYTKFLFVNINRTPPYHSSFVRTISNEKRTKLEETLLMLKDELASKEEEKKEKSLAVSKEKPPIKTRIINELKHYYHGSKLLALETRISLKYFWRLAKGETLLRKEKQQLIRTVSDLFRLVPFSVFIIVPFMELALPLFIKIFPNMLPSTFQEAEKEREKYKKQIKMRIEMAKFLQSTLEEIGLERKDKSDSRSSAALKFANFIKSVREGDGYVSNKDIFKFAKYFEDEITLDNLAMAQLRALCRLLGIQPIGSPEILRFQLKMKLRELQSDDKLIVAEGGVDSLSDIEVQQACRARGMTALGVSEKRLRRQLRQWLALSLNNKIPPTLLLLSRALYFPEHMGFTKRMKIILSQLPKEIADEMSQKLTEIEGEKVNYKARLQLIKKLEETIKDERIFEEDAKKKYRIKIKNENEKLADLEEEKLYTNDITIQNHLGKDLLIDSKKEPILSIDKIRNDKIITPVKNVLDNALNDIGELRTKFIEHKEDILEVTSLGADIFEESKASKRLRAKVQSLITNVDTVVAKIESEQVKMKRADMKTKQITSIDEKDSKI
uniref:Letm1 RBD domain-containing protein n=1 Tax=Parastrongyloides trichosuri TaxID=131310 RepID=A0A0N5A200_PARTI